MGDTTKKMLRSLEAQGMKNRVKALNRSMFNADIDSYVSNQSESQWSTTNKVMYQPHDIKPQNLSV